LGIEEWWVERMSEILEQRVRELELLSARIAQRVEDHENDLRAFGPVVVEQATARQAREQLTAEVHQALQGVERLNEKLAAHITDVATTRMQREERERERQKRDRRYWITTWISIGVVFIAFVGMIITVLQHL
jgi:DNA repair exonuclease SbcCD ATPase subunit